MCLVAAEKVAVWQRVVTGLAAMVLLIGAVAVVIFVYYLGGYTSYLLAIPFPAVVGLALGLIAIRPPSGVIWQRVVMGLAGLSFAVGGVGFDSWGSFSLDYYTGGWGGFSGWGAPFIILGIAFGVAAAVPPKRALRQFLALVGIPVILLSIIGLAFLLFVVSVCACD